jgi:tRNA G18 (ribose-2'-O)-methylase SpoU
MHNIQDIHDIDDPRIEVFRDLPDRQLGREGKYFIAEGELVLERMFQAGYQARKVLVVETRRERVLPLIPQGVEVLLAPRRLVSRIIGFQFHLGVIGCGVRKPPARLEEALADWKQRATLLVLPDTINTRNLGGLFRLAAGMGVDGILLGRRCCDPYYRQCIRVSMGGVFQVPFFVSADLRRDLPKLARDHAMRLYATVVAPGAQALARTGRPDRLALLFGSEARGLDPDLVERCDKRVTIPMQNGADSLNVAVSAGIILHYFQYLAGPEASGNRQGSQ